MRKLLSAALLVLAAASAAGAQDRSIEFAEHGTWSEVVKAARQADRLIFVDCYTNWCGPCRRIANEVFTVNEVADFFNANFVNAKIEMEKNEDGPALAKKYDVKAFPTFLFINPHTEEVEYIKVGGDDGYQWLIEAGTMAMDPERSKSGITARYEAGDRDPGLVRNYIVLLGNLHKEAEQAQVLEEYLDSRSPDDIFTPEGWAIISQTQIDPVSKYFPVIVESRRKFYGIAGQDKVDSYLTYAIRRAAEQIVHPIWEPNAFFVLKNADTRHPALIAALEKVEYPAAKKYLIFLRGADLARRHEWDALLREVAEVEAADLLSGSEEFDYFRYNLTPLARGGSEAQIAKALELLDKKLEDTEDFEQRRNYMQLKNAVKFR